MADIFNWYDDLLANRYAPQSQPPDLLANQAFPQAQPAQTYQTAPDTIPFNTDMTPTPDTGRGTYWDNARQAAGDIYRAGAGVAERFNKGTANMLGLRAPGAPMYQGEIEVGPGMARLADAATFATGGLTSPLSPMAGTFRTGAQFARPAARQNVLAAYDAMLGDVPQAGLPETGRWGPEAGAVRIRPRATSTVAGKGVQQANEDVAAPQIGLGTDQPLFNLENLHRRPDVPQTGIERLPDPQRGVPDWWKRQIEDPANPGQVNPETAAQYKAILQKGRDVAGDENALGWWNTFPLRERTIGEFGEARGDPEWRSGARMLAATSPRHAFPPNISQATYFRNLIAEGKPMPELVKRFSEKNPNQYNLVPVESAPTGYANFPLHIQNINNLLDPETKLLTRPFPLTNPKPATMDRNLVGDWSRPTIDVRDLKAMGATTKGGKPMSSVDPADLYGYTEQNFHMKLAEDLGLDPAQMQSATWVGVPEYFKEFDKSGTGSALSTLEGIIRQNAANLGLTPEQTFRRGWLHSEFPLRWNLK